MIQRLRELSILKMEWNDIVIPDINTIGRYADSPKRKKLVTTHLTQAVRAANKIKKKYEKKKDW